MDADDGEWSGDVNAKCKAVVQEKMSRRGNVEIELKRGQKEIITKKIFVEHCLKILLYI